MPRVVSFIVLVGILLFIATLFFKVMAQFVLPLFLAAVLVVVFKPLHNWVCRKFPGRLRLSALLTTVLILLIVLLPFTWLGWNAFLEGRGVFVYLQVPENRADIIAKAENLLEKIPFANQFVMPAPGEGKPRGQAAADATRQAEPPSAGAPAPPAFDESDQRPPGLAEMDGSADGAPIEPVTPLDLPTIFGSAAGWFGTLLLNTAQGLARMIFGLIILVLGLYYFLADGPAMIRTVMLLSPLDNEYERELLEKFANVSRAVVVAVLASAVVQGLLAGLGFYLALSPEGPVFLLTMATMVLAVVPFVGAAGVWIPTCLWIFFYQGEHIVDGAAVSGEPVKAIVLALYCVGVVSSIDNVIKPLILHGQSNLHPLLALLSVLGGVTALGPVGILVGPMLVAFAHALLIMVNKELRLLGGEVIDTAYAKTAAKVDPRIEIQAEGAVAKPGGVLEQLASAVASPSSGDTAPSGPLGRVREAAKRRRRRK